MFGHRPDQRVGVPDDSDQIDLVILVEQGGHTRLHEVVVVREDHSQGHFRTVNPLGSGGWSASRRVASTLLWSAPVHDDG
jgi:hypothetical protein